MKKCKTKYMSKDRSYKSLKFLSVALIGVLFTGVAISATTPDVSFGQNGVEINTGGLDMGGGDITDGATTIWDASAGNIATSVVDYSAATASDVGLSNVENIALSSATWTDIGIAKSDVSASDVGLGNADNADELDIDGSESMSGNLDMSSNRIKNANRVESKDIRLAPDGSDLWMLDDSTEGYWFRGDASQDVTLEVGYSSGSNYECWLDASNSGDWNCDGAKSWVHDINSTHDAYYTSQESPEVRAVYEGKVDVDGETRVDLPSHFSKTVSNTEPKLRATATVQGQLAYAAVIEKSDDYVVIDSSEPSTVNYRITGVREGYEDKQVVRPKEE